MIRVETDGSVWMIDEDVRRYARMPKQEGPRSSPHGQDWGGPTAGPGLQDLVWHDYVEWRLVDEMAVTVRSRFDWATGDVTFERGDVAPTGRLELRISIDDERVVVAPGATVGP